MREENGDEHNRNQVVDDSKCQQKDANVWRKPPPDQGNKPKSERDVGGDRNRPASRKFRAGNNEVDRGWHSDKAAH